MRVIPSVACVLVLGACSLLQHTVVDCQYEDRCRQSVQLARSLLPAGAQRITVTAGRSPPGVYHAEVHACYQDGRYLLVDVLDDDRGLAHASIRAGPLPDPACR